MILLSRRSLLAVAAVVDIAIHARPVPVAAKGSCGAPQPAAAPPGNASPILVKAGFSKGFAPARRLRACARASAHQRREIVRAALSDPERSQFGGDSPLVQQVVSPLVAKASSELIALMDSTTVEDLCRQADALAVFGAKTTSADFTI